MTIRWITPQLGTAPALGFFAEEGMELIDVRDLVDKCGNSVDVVRQKIAAGVTALKRGKRTIVACDYGISRSNAVAIGILVLHENLPFSVAARRVMEATGEREIKLGPLDLVRQAVGERIAVASGIKRVLVTGPNGSIGRALLPALSREFEVIAVPRSEADLKDGNTILSLISSERSPNFIIHLANPKIYSSTRALGETLTLLRNVIDVCITQNVHLFYMSGWEVYSGYRSVDLCADESLPLLPLGPYGESKYLCEVLIAHYRRTLGLKCTILRSSPVYGIGMDKPKFIYNFIDKITRSEAVVSHRYRNSVPALDLLYVDDLVCGVVAALTSGETGDFNLGTGVLTSTGQVATVLRELLGGDSDISQAPIGEDTACIRMDTRKAQRVFGWQPTVSVREGLERVLSGLN